MMPQAGDPSEKLAALKARFSGKLAVAAVGAPSGSRVEVAADAVVATASVAKVVILCHAMEQLARAGEGKSLRIPVKDAHRVGGSGVLKLMRSVDSLSFADVATLMVAVSDNVATNALMEWAGGPGEATDWARSYGLEATIVHDYVTPEIARRGVRAFAESTAADLSRLGVWLAGLEGQPPPWREEVLAILATQQYRDLVPRYWDLDTAADLFEGVRPTVQVSSKTGFFPGMRAELGIVLNGEGDARMVYAVVAEESRDTGMGPEAEPAVVCGLVGRELARGWLSDVPGIRVTETPYQEWLSE